MDHGTGEQDGRTTGGMAVDRRSALRGAGLLAMAALPVSALSGGAAQAQEEGGPPPDPNRPTITKTISEYAAATDAGKLPPEVKERARKVIFDEMCSAYFGRVSPGGRLAVEYVRQMGYAGDTGEARIYGTNLRASGPFAAMANGSAGHGDEVDGTHVVGGHPGASIVHTCTAITARQKASGAELLNAVVLGYDVGVRMVEACGGKFSVRERLKLTSDFLYSVGCTAAAARVLKLSPERIRHAFALVTFQVNGLNALYAEQNHVSKSFLNGQYAYAGISSAFMSQAGLEGNEDIIGYPEGALDAWGVPQARAAADADLGSKFKIMGANFKFYNAGQPIHTPIEAAMQLVTQHKIAPRSIKSVQIGLPAAGMKTVYGRAMHNINVQDMVAANIARGGLKLVDYPFPAILEDPIYKQVRARTTAAVDAEINREFPDGRGGRVTITTNDGKSVSLRIDNPKGHSRRGEPSWEDLLGKWRGSLSTVDVEKAMELARKIDQLPSAAPLFDAFAGVMVHPA